MDGGVFVGRRYRLTPVEELLGRYRYNPSTGDWEERARDVLVQRFSGAESIGVAGDVVRQELGEFTKHYVAVMWYWGGDYKTKYEQRVEYWVPPGQPVDETGEELLNESIQNNFDLQGKGPVNMDTVLRTWENATLSRGLMYSQREVDRFEFSSVRWSFKKNGGSKASGYLRNRMSYPGLGGEGGRYSL